jgi:hypothetical protein
METILLSGESKENTRLLMQLAKQLKFTARKLSSDEIEEMGILISIKEGVASGLLDDSQKLEFLESLK